MQVQVNTLDGKSWTLDPINSTTLLSHLFTLLPEIDVVGKVCVINGVLFSDLSLRISDICSILSFRGAELVINILDSPPALIYLVHVQVFDHLTHELIIDKRLNNIWNEYRVGELFNDYIFPLLHNLGQSLIRDTLKKAGALSIINMETKLSRLASRSENTLLVIAESRRNE